MKREPDEEVSRAIEMTNICQTLHVLPKPGGVLDQDSYHIYMIQCVLAAQAEKNELENKRRSTKGG